MAINNNSTELPVNAGNHEQYEFLRWVRRDEIVLDTVPAQRSLAYIAIIGLWAWNEYFPGNNPCDSGGFDCSILVTLIHTEIQPSDFACHSRCNLDIEV